MHPLGAGRSPTDELERKTAHDTVYFTPPVWSGNYSVDEVKTSKGKSFHLIKVTIYHFTLNTLK